jgi:hypothetical protein
MVLGMSPDERGELVSFHGYDAIARRAHVNRRTVVRVVGWQRDSSAPLIQISRPQQTKGVRHPTFRFTLVRDPLAFAAARDRARAEELERFRQHYDFPDKAEHQKAVVLAATPELEAQAKASLKRATRKALLKNKGRLPLRAVEPLITETGTLLPATNERTKTRASV